MTVRLADDVWLLLFAAWAVSLAATLGALFIGEIMGQAPCLLCWYQRIFMFPLPIILGIGLLRSDASMVIYVLPLAVLGGLTAAYHSLQYGGIIPEALTPCTQGGPSCSGPGMTLLGWVPIPGLSLMAFAAITIALMLAYRRAHS